MIPCMSDSQRRVLTDDPVCCPTLPTKTSALKMRHPVLRADPVILAYSDLCRGRVREDEDDHPVRMQAGS